MTVGDTYAITGLRLAYEHLSVAYSVASDGKMQPPPMEDFVPDVLHDEPEAPADFDSWAQALLGAFVPTGA